MTLVIAKEHPPLHVNADNIVLIGQTRVTLDTLVSAFKQGATAEEIVYRYPSLKLADVYATITYYLNHQESVEEYLAKNQSRAQKVRAINESSAESQKIRKRLLARKQESKAC